MIFGLFQVALGLALIGAAVALGGPAWFFAWPGVAVLVVGLGYLGLGPRVFGKRAADGRMSAWALGLVFPYVVVAWSLWQLKSRLYDGRPWDEVAPGVYVGRRPLGPHELPEGTRCVVDMTSELPRAVPEVPRYLCVPTLDTSVPSDGELAALVETLASEPGPLFIHCAMGHGRSATVAAALLIRKGLAANVDEAVAALVKARPRVRLHGVQREAVARLGAPPDAGRTGVSTTA